MKKYMLVWQGDGKQHALFCDTSAQAHDIKMDVECGMGGYCEVYERTMDEDGVESYTFLYA